METKGASSSQRQSRIWMIIAVIFGIILVISLVAVLALAISLGVTVANTENSMGDNVCMTTECVELSSQISSYMDMSVNPCEDFYAFTCNGFRDEAIYPFGEESLSVLSQKDSVNTERIRSIMESREDQNLSSLQKTFEFYESCMDLPAIDRQSVPALHEVLLSLGGWPLVGMDLNIPWSINNENGYLTEHLYDSRAFFRLFVLPSLENSNSILFIDQAGLTIPSRRFYAGNASRAYLIDVMVEVFTAINSSMPEDSYLEAAEEIVDFETELADIFDFQHFFTPLAGSFNSTTYSYLMEIFPEFDWTKNLAFFGKFVNFTVKPTDMVGLLAPTSFLEGLNRLIRDTSPRILQNYAKWHFILNVLEDLSAPFRDVYYELLELLTGNSNIPPRYKHCVYEVEEGFKYAVARSFADKYISSDTMNNVSVMLTEIKKVFADRLREKDWLDATTKERALNKLDLTESFIAYPLVIKNNVFLDSLYSDFNVSASNGHFINKLNTRRSRNIFEWSYIGSAVSRDVWYLNAPSPTLVNAFYAPSLNQIYILEGILETPIFETYWPDYFKYSTIGYVAGHEYTHGFDTGGRLYDGFGNLEDWWSESSIDEYNTRTRCLAEQYSNYSIPGGQVDGNQTLDENIADNGGLVLSYSAYRNVVKKNGPEKMLPGLPYTPDQLFFIGLSQIYCRAATIANQARLLSIAPHSPPSIRSVGTLSNSEAFAEAFNCPAGSFMNPIKKCEVW